MTTAGNRASETAERLKHSIQESADKVAHAASEAVHKAEHKLSEAAAAAEKKGEELGETVKQGAQRLADKARAASHPGGAAGVTKAEEDAALLAKQQSDSEQAAVRARSQVVTDKMKI
jgi:hypothetical protein